MPKIAIPTIHLNGTSRDHLIGQQNQIVEAARALYDALRDATPHARDYYVSNEHSIEQALEQHRAICKTVAEIEERAIQIAVAIQDQGV